MKRLLSHNPGTVPRASASGRLSRRPLADARGTATASRFPVVLLIAISLLLAACQQTAPKPVELLPEDMCALCKMAISEKRYAAEFITHDGEALKFDDLGCMADYVEGRKNLDQIASFFVVDSETKQWLKAEEAHYVSSSKFQTPMSGGVVAFRDRAKAEAAAVANQGRLLSFAEVISKARKAGE